MTEVQASTFELQISVARIEGMLTGSLARHDQRLDQHENTITQIDNRVREKGNIIARHDERIKDLEQDNDARFAKSTGIMAIVLALIGTAIAVINRIELGI